MNTTGWKNPGLKNYSAPICGASCSVFAAFSTHFESPRIAPFSRLRTQHELRFSIGYYSDPIPVVEFPLGQGRVARSGGAVRSGRFKNLVGLLLYRKVQRLMAQVFAETPLGVCMVSSEGACAAYYRYGRYQEVA